MSSLPKYTDVANLRYVENSYTVSEGAPTFPIPTVNADRRIVNLTIEFTTGEPPLEIRLPARWEPYQKLTLNLFGNEVAPPATPTVRELSIRRKNTSFSLSWTEICQVQESEGPNAITQLHFKSGEDGKWVLDYEFDPASAQLDQVDTLLVSGSSVTELNNTYTKLFKAYNGKPQYTSDAGTIFYDILEGWTIQKSDLTTTISGLGSAPTQYPWEANYPGNVYVARPELFEISQTKAPLYPDIRVFGLSSTFDGVYKAVKKAPNVSSPINFVYAKEGSPLIYLFLDTTGFWILMNGGSLVTSSRIAGDFPWEVSYGNSGTIVTRLDQIYPTPSTFQISSPITHLVDANRLTEITISNLAGTSSPSIFILPGFQETAGIFKGGAVNGDIFIVNHTQSASNTTAEIKAPTWTGSGYTGTLTTLATFNRTGRWIFRFNAGLWSILAVPQHTHLVGDLTQSGATTGQVIKWNGTVWAPGDDTGGSGSGMTWSSVPATPTSTGIAGQMAYADNYLYVCVATNVWKRTILATW